MKTLIIILFFHILGSVVIFILTFESRTTFTDHSDSENNPAQIQEGKPFILNEEHTIYNLDRSAILYFICGALLIAILFVIETVRFFAKK